MTVQSLRRRHDGKRALVVHGGWEGHVPVPASDRYVRVLKEAGFGVTVSDSLDSYLDEALLANSKRDLERYQVLAPLPPGGQ